MRIQELFTQPFAWKWTDQSGGLQKAEFSTGKIQYTVNFYLFEEDIDEWLVEFDAGPSAFGITGTGDSAQVFATVIDIIKKFKQTHPKSRLKFSASEPSRQKLYLSLVKRLSPQYDVEHDELLDKIYYTVF